MARNRNPADLAEVHGGGLAEKLIEDFRDAEDQAERLRLLHRALMEAAEGLYPSRSLGGFSVVLVAYLDHAFGLDK
jgi:hypothetical protein